MFERFTHDARRALFFARTAVSEHGGERIGTAHLLMGILRTLPPSSATRLGVGEMTQHLSECLVTAMVSQTLRAESEEIPFDPAAKLVLQRVGRKPAVPTAAGGQDIAPADLLLALLRERPEEAVTCVERAGLDILRLEQDLAAERDW